MKTVATPKHKPQNYPMLKIGDLSNNVALFTSVDSATYVHCPNAKHLIGSDLTPEQIENFKEPFNGVVTLEN